MDRSEALGIGQLDAHDQAVLVASGDLSSSELVEAAIIRANMLEPVLNTMSIEAWNGARAAASTAAGPMCGVPWLVKEGLDYAGMPTRSGSRAFHDVAPSAASHPFARRLDAAGLVAIGKSVAPEFGLLPTTEPQLYGVTRNPWSISRSAGGSSGGAAAAVAAGIVPLAHAADGGGSIRIPASCCGVVGLKPGRGTTVRAREHHAIEDFLVGDTLIARSVRDVAWATRATAAVPLPSHDGISRRLRVGIVTDSLTGTAPAGEVAAVIERTAALCEQLGHNVNIFRRREDGPRLAAAFRTIWGYLARDAVTNARARGADLSRLEPWTLELAEWGARFSAADLDAFHRDVAAATIAHEEGFASVDVILSPVLRRITAPLGELAPDRPFQALFDSMFDYIGYTPLHNLTGHPAISLPLFAGTDGVPIGSMFSAARGGESDLLALASELEEASGWRDRWPPVSAAAWHADVSRWFAAETSRP